LDNAHIASRAGRPYGVVRTGNLHVESYFTSRIISYGARVVVVGPILGIVIILADIINFIFGFYITVLSNTKIYSYP